MQYLDASAVCGNNTTIREHTGMKAVCHVACVLGKPVTAPLAPSKRIRAPRQGKHHHCDLTGFPGTVVQDAIAYDTLRSVSRHVQERGMGRTRVPDWQHWECALLCNGVRGDTSQTSLSAALQGSLPRWATMMQIEIYP
jgi:hypothetical protein